MPRGAVTRAQRRFADRAWLDYARIVIAAEGPAHPAGARNLTHVAEIIAHYADRATLRSRPTIAVLIQATGLSRRCIQYWLRWLEDSRRGLLEVSEPGTTPQFRPAAWASSEDAGKNLAREWQLLPPPGSRSCTPSLTPTASFPHPGTREEPATAGQGQDSEERRCAAYSPLLAPPPWQAQAREWPPGTTPQRRGERLAAAQTLRARHMVLRRLSARRLRAILRPWHTAPRTADSGPYTPADILHALDFRPGGQPHTHADRVRDPRRLGQPPAQLLARPRRAARPPAFRPPRRRRRTRPPRRRAAAGTHRRAARRRPRRRRRAPRRGPGPRAHRDDTATPAAAGHELKPRWRPGGWWPRWAAT